MKVCFVLFVLSLTASSSALKKRFPTARIFGGKTASRGQFPWQALVIPYYSLNKTTDAGGRCGGVLISPKWILTAAHCIKKEDEVFEVEVHLGMICADDKNKTTIKAKKLELHPDYDIKTPYLNDIGLIELRESVKFSDRISSIPIISKEVPTGKKLIVSGFGQTDFTDSALSNYLLFVDVAKVEKEECIKMYCPILPETIVCSKGEGIKDACFGDSGGPLIAYEEDKAYLVGIVSAGFEKCGQGKPRIYSNVLAYRKWINSILKHEFYKTYISTRVQFAARLPQAGVPVKDECSEVL